MANKVILVLTESWDSHSDVVINHLRLNGEEVVRFDTDHFFNDHVQIEYQQTAKRVQPNVVLWVKGQPLPVDKIKSVWCRRPKPVVVNIITDKDQRQFAERELNELILNYHHLLHGAFWVSDLLALEQARRKLSQLESASNLGFLVPKTLVTNRPETIEAFFGVCKKKMIYKTLHTPNLVVDGELLGIQTSLVTEENLAAVGLISHSGGIFQEYLPKSFEIRVTIIGREVFSVKIDSQVCDAGKIDWREALSLGKVPVEPIVLPKKIYRACLRLICDYGLQFGAIDLVVTPGGQYYFLELNPNGQWYWVEHLTGMPMVATMADLLTKAGSP